MFLLQPGFKDRDVYPLTSLSMMLGEFNYIDTFTTGANDPFAIDGYCIMFLFFLVMPLALMNFLVSIFKFYNKYNYLEDNGKTSVK